MGKASRVVGMATLRASSLPSQLPLLTFPVFFKCYTLAIFLPPSVLSRAPPLPPEFLVPPSFSGGRKLKESSSTQNGTFLFFSWQVWAPYGLDEIGDYVIEDGQNEGNLLAMRLFWVDAGDVEQLFVDGTFKGLV
jgi:hypothetical protein